MDVVFGSVNWARDLSKVTFVGEVPAIASYKNPWDLPEAKPEEKKEPEHWQEDKYIYEEEFGELLVGKKQAAIFVYDLISNKIQKVLGIPDNVWPQYPVFDEHSQGLVFTGVHLPNQKLGLIYCLNRPNSLYYIRTPEFLKLSESNEYL